MTRTLSLILAASVTSLACAKKPAPTDAVTTTVEYEDDSTVDVWQTRIYVDKPLAEACELPADTVFFDVASMQLDAYDRTLLRKVGECLKTEAMSDEALVVTGHTDPTGPSAYNTELGEDRAMTVRIFLVDKVGVAPDRINVETMGEAEAIEHPFAWPLDRKVELRLADKVDVQQEVTTVDVDPEDLDDDEE